MTSSILAKEVILPYPYAVLQRVLTFLSEPSFYIAVAYSLARVVVSFVLAMATGIFLGVLGGLYLPVRELLAPLMTLLQTIPQIGYILVLLMWFSSTTALIWIVYLMLMPIFYYNALQGVLHIDDELKDVIALYHHSFWFNLRVVYLPLIKGYIQSALQSCVPLGIKVAVMAEIFVSSKYGIGKQLYFARVQIDMTGIFAWIICMMLITAILNRLIGLFIQKK